MIIKDNLLIDKIHIQYSFTYDSYVLWMMNRDTEHKTWVDTPSDSSSFKFTFGTV